MNRIATAFIRRVFPFAGLSAILLVVSLSGCEKKAGPVAGPQTPAAPVMPIAPAAPEPREDQVVITVNDAQIRESQVQQRLDVRYKPTLAKLAEQSPQLAAQQESILRRNIANDLITETLLEEQARQAGIQVTEEDLKNEMTKQLAAQNPPMTIEQYQAIVEAQGGDFVAMKSFILQNMRYHKLLETKFAGQLAVTEEEAKKYYDENGNEFLLPERVRASHILIPTAAAEPDADPSQVKAQARAKAQKLLEEIKGGGDFAALAKQHSTCPSSANGGDLGLFSRGQMVKPFEDAAFSLQAGEVGELVETQFGYHIVKVTEHADATPIPFEEAKATILEEVAQQKRADAIRKYIESLRQGARIVYVSESFAPVPPPSRPAPVGPAPAPSPPAPAAPADANGTGQ